MIVVGDIHGHYDVMVEVLRDEARMIAPDLTWIAGTETVCFIGDYVNRGPDGIKVIDFLISLQLQAEMAGGRVIALLGNHEPFFLAAHLLGDQRSGGSGGTFLADWRNLGTEHDLQLLTPEHVAWMIHLPAMVRIGKYLILHGDASLYLGYGKTIREVNQRLESILCGFDPEAWDKLLYEFSAHREFWNNPALAHTLLETYGGETIIHGHSTIGTILDKPHKNAAGDTIEPSVRLERGPTFGWGECRPPFIVSISVLRLTSYD